MSAILGKDDCRIIIMREMHAIASAIVEGRRVPTEEELGLVSGPLQKDEQPVNKIPASWYLATNAEKHLRQIVISLPAHTSVPPRVSNLVGGGSFMVEQWALTVLPIIDKGGPFVFAKATGVVEMLKQQPVTIAFSFYRYIMGGFLNILVYADSPTIRAKAGSYYIAVDPRWPGSEEDKQTIDALLDLDSIEVCFCAPGSSGPCTGYFGLAVSLLAD